MRTALYLTAGLALAALVPPEAMRAGLATAASTLLEAAPLVLAAGLVARVLPWPALAPYLGCGCGAGPGARSLVAAVATAALFGPWAALARVAGATLVAALLGRRAGARIRTGACCGGARAGLGELAALVPTALLAGVAAQALPRLDLAALGSTAQAVSGALLGFALAPCALGVAPFASVLHARAPAAATAFLCVAGIVDARAFASLRRVGSIARPHHDACGDACAYGLLGVALLLVGARHGAGLVHPAFAPVLMLTGAGALATALAARRPGTASSRCRSAPAWRIAPALMLFGLFANAPAPQYFATETTLAGLFPGERLSFAGRLVRARRNVALVRFAITCCRADAAPIVVRLARDPRFADGTWLRADGIVAAAAGGFTLAIQRIGPIAAPSDPFVYR